MRQQDLGGYVQRGNLYFEGIACCYREDVTAILVCVGVDIGHLFFP
jgi:hypothetical protein